MNSNVNTENWVERGDRPTPKTAECLPVTLVLDNLRSAFNVGNIFRLAEATRAEHIVTCGYTATPPHPKLAKTARGCDTSVPCSHQPTVRAALESLRERGYTVYGVETVSDAIPVWDVAFRFPAALLLGNEALGISEDGLELCDSFVKLPCLGTKNSINVGNCAGVVLYRALEQWLPATRTNVG